MLYKVIIHSFEHYDSRLLIRSVFPGLAVLPCSTKYDVCCVIHEVSLIFLLFWRFAHLHIRNPKKKKKNMTVFVSIL